MGSILICHAQEDAASAEELGAALTKRGLKVWFVGDAAKDPNWLSALYIYDSVVVFWSQTSVVLVQFHDIARAALKVNRLLPVRAENLAVERLPAEFRKLNTPLISDQEGITRVLGHIRPPAEPPVPRQAGAAERPAPEVGAAEPRREPLQPGSIGSGSRASPIRRTEGIGAAAEPLRPPMSPSSVRDDTRFRIEGVGAATPAAPRSIAAAAPQQEALAVEAGRLVHKIPEKMWIGEPEVVEVRLGRAASEALTQGLVGRGALTSQDIPILETMSVSIYAKGGAFDIERQSETTQLVSSEHLKGTAFEQADYGRWVWQVTPRKTGAHQLFVRVSASLKDSRGLPTSTSLPDREFPVSVSVHTGKTAVRIVRRGLLAAGGTVGAGLLGAITQEMWWPKLKVLLQSWGWLD